MCVCYQGKCGVLGLRFATSSTYYRIPKTFGTGSTAVVWYGMDMVALCYASSATVLVVIALRYASIPPAPSCTRCQVH